MLPQGYMDCSGSEDFIADLSPEERKGLQWRKPYDRWRPLCNNNNQQDFHLTSGCHSA